MVKTLFLLLTYTLLSIGLMLGLPFVLACVIDHFAGINIREASLLNRILIKTLLVVSAILGYLGGLIVWLQALPGSIKKREILRLHHNYIRLPLIPFIVEKFRKE